MLLYTSLLLADVWCMFATTKRASLSNLSCLATPAFLYNAKINQLRYMETNLLKWMNLFKKKKNQKNTIISVKAKKEM